MAQSPIQTAIQQICQEKNISEEGVIQAINLALAAAYRKDFGNKLQNIVADFDVKTGGVKVCDIKTVVEDMPEEMLDELTTDIKKGKAEASKTAPVKNDKEKTNKVADKPQAYIADEEEVRRFNPKTEIQLSEAKAIDKKYKIDDEIITPLEVHGEFGRMAAQTAKQVIIQKLREVERENVYNEYKALEFEVVNGSIQRREGRNVLVDLERGTAMMPPEEQMVGERYNIGNRMKFYLMSVDNTTRGPQIIVSRAHPNIVRKIFETEIPEVANGSIEIKGIAREAGHRSKIAINSNDDSIDPIGSCVGQRGSRIQTIIGELNGEKIDIILWDADPVQFIINALSPAKVLSVELNEDGDEKHAKVMVKEDQLSLAIGRAGQNVRLASKLTSWKIDIISDGGQKVAEAKPDGEAVLADEANELTQEQEEVAEDSESKTPEKES